MSYRPIADEMAGVELTSLAACDGALSRIRAWRLAANHLIQKYATSTMPEHVQYRDRLRGEMHQSQAIIGVIKERKRQLADDANAARPFYYYFRRAAQVVLSPEQFAAVDREAQGLMAREEERRKARREALLTGSAIPTLGAVAPPRDRATS